MCRISENQFDPLRGGRKIRLFMCRLKGASRVQLTKQRNYLDAKTFPLFPRICDFSREKFHKFPRQFLSRPQPRFRDVKDEKRSLFASDVNTRLLSSFRLDNDIPDLLFFYSEGEQKNKQIHKVCCSCFYTNINCGLCFLPEPRETRNDQQRRNGRERNPARIKPRKGEKIGKEPKQKK